MRISRTLLVALVALVPLAALAACSDGAAPASSANALEYPVDQSGPFTVGYRSWEITYSPPIGAARTIKLNVWYPSTDTSGENPVYGVVKDRDVFIDAKLAPPVDPAGYPVHVYSHGWAGFGGTSSDLMRFFASHGWVAIAPDHTGNLFPDDPPALPPSIYYLRSLDISQALDALEKLPAGDPLAGKCRTARVFMSGHSFGTITTWASIGATFDLETVKAKCADGKSFSVPCTPDEIALFAKGLGDPRVVAGVPMAGGADANGGLFGPTGYDAVKKPMMLMSGTEDKVGAENVFARASTVDLTWLDIAGGCHQTFALGGCEKLETDEGYRIVNTYALALARHAVLGDTSERVAKILDGSEVLSDKVKYRHKP